MKKNCVIVCGPTASGKTTLAIHLAQRFQGVIISADSMQIYRGMHVGTAKPTPKEQLMAPHRLIDVCDPGDSFSVARYQALAKEEMEIAVENGSLPILAGGTGLYIDSVLYNTQFADIPEDKQVRLQLEEEYDRKGANEMLKLLARVDPVASARLSPADRKRILRALEIYRVTGKTITYFNERSQSIPSDFRFLTLVLCFENRQTLYDRIDTRVDQMINNGLIDEAERLFNNGYAATPTASQAIGYKELFAYLKGNASLEDAVAQLKQRSRNYAKRQIAWFKKYDAIHLNMEKADAMTQAEDLVRQFIGEKL